MTETKIGFIDLKSASVHFHLQNSRNRGNAGKKFTFPSKTNFLNVGNGFDWDNQWFLAPYTGIYFFALSGVKSKTQEVRASIFVRLNGNDIGEALSSDKTEYGTLSLQFSRKLEKGDKIELVMHAQSREVYLLYFTGWMLEQELILI